jgi:hypothetical protein
MSCTYDFCNSSSLHDDELEVSYKTDQPTEKLNVCNWFHLLLVLRHTLFRSQRLKCGVHSNNSTSIDHAELSLVITRIRGVITSYRP